MASAMHANDVFRDAGARKIDVLKLEMSGRFAINVVVRCDSQFSLYGG